MANIHEALRNLLAAVTSGAPTEVVERRLRYLANQELLSVKYLLRGVHRYDHVFGVAAVRNHMRAAIVALLASNRNIRIAGSNSYSISWYKSFATLGKW